MEKYTYTIDEEGVLRIYGGDGRLVSTILNVPKGLAWHKAFALIEQWVHTPFQLTEKTDDEEDLLDYLYTTLSSNAQYDGHDFTGLGCGVYSTVFMVDGRKFKLLEIK